MIGVNLNDAASLGFVRAFRVLDGFLDAAQSAQRDGAIEIAATTVFAAKLAKDAVALFLAAHHVALHVAARFAGYDQLRIFDIFFNHKQTRFQLERYRS